MAAVTSEGDNAIAARITDLNNLSTRVAAVKNVSAVEKASISTEVQNEITGLTNLKTKLDADTDLTTAKTDEQSIFTAYRIYALVVPQGMIMASADRVDTIASLMDTLSTKFQARITAAQTAGNNVTNVQAALTDFNTKVADATTQAQTAQNAVANLVPDQGNATTAASNKAALQSARADLKTATSDLKAARADANTIVAGLKAFKVSAATATSTTATH